MKNIVPLQIQKTQSNSQQICARNSGNESGSQPKNDCGQKTASPNDGPKKKRNRRFKRKKSLLLSPKLVGGKMVACVKRTRMSPTGCKTKIPNGQKLGCRRKPILKAVRKRAGLLPTPGSNTVKSPLQTCPPIRVPPSPLSSTTIAKFSTYLSNCIKSNERLNEEVTSLEKPASQLSEFENDSSDQESTLGAGQFSKKEKQHALRAQSPPMKMKYGIVTVSPCKRSMLIKNRDPRLHKINANKNNGRCENHSENKRDLPQLMKVDTRFAAKGKLCDSNAAKSVAQKSSPQKLMCHSPRHENHFEQRHFNPNTEERRVPSRSSNSDKVIPSKPNTAQLKQETKSESGVRSTSPETSATSENKSISLCHPKPPQKIQTIISRRSPIQSHDQHPMPPFMNNQFSLHQSSASQEAFCSKESGSGASVIHGDFSSNQCSAEDVFGATLDGASGVVSEEASMWRRELREAEGVVPTILGNTSTRITPRDAYWIYFCVKYNGTIEL